MAKASASSTTKMKPLKPNTIKSMHRRIISNPFDSDSDVSFVQPYGDKKCRVSRPTIMDKITNNAAELQNYGQRLALQANHAIQTFVAASSDTEEGSDGDDSGDTVRRRRRAGNKAMEMLLDGAGRCAASLKTVAQEVPEACLGESNPCMALVHAGDDYSSSDDERRPVMRRTVRKKRVSEAKPHDGSLSEEISVTSDSRSYGTMSFSTIVSSDESSGNGNGNSFSTSDSLDAARVSKLRRRRQQFLRRKAMERAAGAQTDDEEDGGTVASLRFGGPRLGLKKMTKKQNKKKKKEKKKSWKNLPSQELRCENDVLTDIGSPKEKKQPLREASIAALISKQKAKQNLEPFDGAKKMVAKSAINEPLASLGKGGPTLSLAKAAIGSMMPDLVNTTNDDSLLDTTIDDDLNMTLINKNGAKGISRDGSNVSLNIGVSGDSFERIETPSPKQLRWQSMETTIPHLLPSPIPSHVFLETSHLGPVLSRTPCKSMGKAGLQLGDVIIRLNGDDMSSVEATAVSEMIDGMAGESISVTFLRKNMML